MKIWASSCPAKIVLFGEWGVLKGAPAICSTVISRLQTEIIENHEIPTLKFTDDSPDLQFSPVEIPRLDDDAEIPAEWQRVARDLKFLSKQFSISPNGWHIKLRRDWKISEGYGSSSALSLSLYCALKSKLDPSFRIPSTSSERARIFESSCEIQDLINLDGGSGIDFAVQWMGGNILYQSISDQRLVKPLHLSFPKNLVILHTGRKVKTMEAIKSSDFILPFVKTLTSSVEEFLLTRDWDRTINQHFEVFKETPVVPGWIAQLRTDLLDKKLCTALKTTGAGGGDALLVLLRENKKEEFCDWATKNGFWLSSYAFHAEGAALS